MGVPSFYRWLVRKYPLIIVEAIESSEPEVDTSQPNHNGEFDNLYLDMNGIIHPCFHPENEVFSPITFEEVFLRIFKYIDRIFAIIRPRKLLFMAIDGVAPRAKINQQRARRFRAAEDSDIAEIEEKKIRKEFEEKGRYLFPEKESEVKDSNVITPGTVFMYTLSNALQGYITEKLRNDSGWKKIKVILSDANVPGEGEHKIMSFIRVQRVSPGYNPNTHHCIYGLDADLIMLSLATHEVHFSVLREAILAQEKSTVTGVNGTTILQKKTYELLNMWTLRDYLELDMNILDLPEGFPKIDIERLIDDFIFLCLFVGNDFLPHMPSLEIHEGAIDLLMTVYKKEFKNLKGYIVDMRKSEDKKGGYIKMKRVEKFITVVGSYEEQIFSKRNEIREKRIKRFLSENVNENAYEDEGNSFDMNMEGSLELENVQTTKGYQKSTNTYFNGPEVAILQDDQILVRNTMELKQKVREFTNKRCDLFKSGCMGTDKVRFGSLGWKERYYMCKLSAESPNGIENIKRKIVQKYAEGLCWVLLYYFSGVPSWTWFYPYHYGPCASDLKGMGQAIGKFEKGSPFKPLDQLMAVLPPKSCHAVPTAYQALMSNDESPIIDFYPDDFEADVDGKRYLWQGICKLPFIDAKRLLSETSKLEPELVGDEVIRNSVGNDILFVSTVNDFGSEILCLCKAEACQKDQDLKIDTNLSDGLNGFMNLCHNGTGGCRLCNITSGEDDVIFVKYKLPDSISHFPAKLPGVDVPEKVELLLDKLNS